MVLYINTQTAVPKQNSSQQQSQEHNNTNTGHSTLGMTTQDKASTNMAHNLWVWAKISIM